MNPPARGPAVLPLPRLGITRAQIVDSLPTCCGQTRRWSQAAYLQYPTAQAVGYGSRRDDAARCLMLFRQRLPDPPFELLGEEPLAIAPRSAGTGAFAQAARGVTLASVTPWDRLL